MKFPWAVFLETIKKGDIYYFKGDNIIKSNENHYYVVLNNPKDNCGNILFAMASSQVEKIKSRIIRCSSSPKTYVIVQPTDCPNIFDKPTGFDCNHSICLFTVAELQRMYEKQEIKHIGNMPEHFLEKIREGVIISDIVEKGYQDMLM